MYKISRKKGQVYELDSTLIKLNYRCPFGEFVSGSYKCGETKEESKKNYEKYQKEKINKEAPKKLERAGKNIAKVTSREDLKPHVEKVRSLIDKVKAELDAGQVSKESHNALKSAVKELRNAKKGNVSVKEDEPKITNKQPETIDKTSSKISNFNDINDSKFSSTFSLVTPDIEKITNTIFKKYPGYGVDKNQLNSLKKDINKSLKNRIPNDKLEDTINELLQSKEPNGLINWRKDLEKSTYSDKETKFLDTYAEKYKTINDFLFKGKNKTSAKSLVSELDNIMKKSELPADVVVYRGLPADIAKKMGLDISEVGTEIKNKGFMSTTVDRFWAENFTNSFMETGTILEIKLKKGQNAAYLTHTTAGRTEREVLVDRNKKYKVSSIREEEFIGQYSIAGKKAKIITLEMVE